MTDDTIRNALVEYARVRDEMYRSAAREDWAAFDAIVPQCRSLTQLLWDLGHELAEAR